MILDCKKTADYISNWIRDYSQKAGVKSLVLGLSGGIDSALVALLCQRTGIPTVAAYMGCHSSPNSYERAALFAGEVNLPLFVVNLDSAFATIQNQFNSSSFAPQLTAIVPDWTSNGSAGALRSCLRAPTLSFLAHAVNGVIVGTGNRSEDHLLRYFQKYGDGCVDISPISDLFKSEVRELFKFLAEELNNGTMNKAAQMIYDAKPSADLWGSNSGQEDEKELGLTYDEVEWGDRENARTVIVDGSPFDYAGIVENDIDPTKHNSNAWLGYTERQKQIVSKMHSLEKVSRHKFNASLPVCYVREKEGLVR